MQNDYGRFVVSLTHYSIPFSILLQSIYKECTYPTPNFRLVFFALGEHKLDSDVAFHYLSVLSYCDAWKMLGISKFHLGIW